MFRFDLDKLFIVNFDITTSLHIILIIFLIFFILLFLGFILFSLDQILFNFTFSCVFVGKEALNVVVLHSAWRTHILNEANHGSIAFRVELVIIINLNIRDTFGTVFHRRSLHVLLKGVTPVSQEPLSILKFDFEGLIVETIPISIHFLAFAFILRLAELR